VKLAVKLVLRRLVSALLICAAAAPSGGCATMWGLSKIISDKPPFEEKSSEQAVPLPGVKEQLVVTLHLEGKPVPPANAANTPTTPTPPPAAGASASQPPEPVVECLVAQTGREEVYHAATYYGRNWKWLTGISFVIEAALGTALLLGGDKTTHYVFGAYWAADALVTGVLYFAPERSSYEHFERNTLSRVRHDCPEGLLIELAGRPVPVDADGALSPLALALLGRHMTTTPEPIRVRMGAFGEEIALDPALRCSWARRRSLPAAAELCKVAGAERPLTSTGASSPAVAIEVPLGLLTTLP
jgi:hypothetical protein